MTRRSWHRRRHTHRWRRWTAGPQSYQDRLREAAFGGHTCRLYAVTIEQGA